MTQKEDYKHENELCKKKIEQQVKDIERLRNDLKNAKKSAFNPPGAFTGGSDIATKLGQGIANKYGF